MGARPSNVINTGQPNDTYDAQHFLFDANDEISISASRAYATYINLIPH